MTRTMLAAGLFVAALFSSRPSQAQDFYKSGEVSIAIERALGVHYVHASYDPPGPGDFDVNGTTFGFGWYGALTPQPSWGIILAPTIDLGFTGEAGNDVDYSEFSIGIPAIGLLGNV